MSQDMSQEMQQERMTTQAVLDAIPWAEPRALWRQIGAQTFLHWPAHVADIERALGARAEVR